MNNFQLPNGIYDLSSFDRFADEKHIARIKKLIKNALASLDEQTEYELCEKAFNYGVGQCEPGSHYGLNFHLKEKICAVFGTQRDIAYLHAIFPLSESNMAAKYFVWLVSDGKAKIDWTLFLDMEP